MPLYNSQGQKSVDFDRTYYSGGGDFGYAFGRFREFRAGYEYGYLSTLDTGASVPQPLKGQYGTTRAVFRRDTRNGPLVPTRGSFFDLRAAWLDRYPGVGRSFPAYEGLGQRSLSLNPQYPSPSRGLAEVPSTKIP